MLTGEDTQPVTAARAQARALAAERGQQADLFGDPSHRLTLIQKKEQ